MIDFTLPELLGGEPLDDDIRKSLELEADASYRERIIATLVSDHPDRRLVAIAIGSDLDLLGRGHGVRRRGLLTDEGRQA